MNNKRQNIFLTIAVLVLISVAFLLVNASHAITRETSIQYIVKPGDTCTQIAYKYGVPVRTIVEYNGMPSDCTLMEGQMLIIPLP